MNDAEKVYIVYELVEQREIQPGVAAPVYRNIVSGQLVPNAEHVRSWWRPEPVGCFPGRDARDGCIEAARATRRFGNYIAVAGELLTLDFTAAPIELPASAIEEV